MQIFQIIQGLYIPSAGPTYSVAKLSDELCTLNQNSSVLTQGVPPYAWPYNTPLKIYDGFIERKTGLSYGLMKELKSLMKTECILHGNGVWRPSTLFPLMFQKGRPAKIIWSPRGTLSEWSMRHKKLIKQPFWKTLQEPALRKCHCFHATSVIEYEDIRRLGFTAPVAIIPNGVNIPKLSQNKKKKRIVFLGRINPIKGIDMLISAWAEIAQDFPDWELTIAGPLQDDYANTIQNQARTLNIQQIKFTGEVLNDEKHELLSSAALFVLPSHSENFGIAIAEALAYGVPVITTTGTPWHEIESKNCGWYIKPDTNSLKKAMRSALNLPLESLMDMGKNGRKWMNDDYSWKNVANNMQKTYEWLLYDTPKPTCIIEH